MNSRRMLALLAVVPTLALNTTTARAETVNCTASTVPTVISVRGVTLHGQPRDNINTSIAIDIQTNNVVLDLNGFKLAAWAPAPAPWRTASTRSIGRTSHKERNGARLPRGIFLENVSVSQGCVIEGTRRPEHVGRDPGRRGRQHRAL
jgi:hypothetical protein